eukprot:5552175-Lingulodinium_polyedra.AAC.1
MLPALAAQLCRTGYTAVALGAMMALGMPPCVATRDEVDATLVAEALMEDLPPGARSCTVDVWPG